jgi:VanZ family protein
MTLPLWLRRLLKPHQLPIALRLAGYAVAVTVLLYMTLAPSKDLPNPNIWDKAEHAISWMVLAGIGLSFWPHRPGRIAALSMLVGVLVEVLQSALPFGRDGDVRDLLGDGAGVAAALVVWAVVRACGRRFYPQAATARPSGIT